MREILFRGKRVGNGEWVYGFYHNCTTLEHLFSDKLITQHRIYTQSFGYEVKEETVGQYTGLKDKNGKMIFEGDIVEDYQGGKYKVIYDTIYMSFALLQGKINWHLESFKEYKDGIIDNMEVLGNIYDNTELLD